MAEEDWSKDFTQGKVSERVDEINISITLYHMYMHVCVLGCRHKMSARGSLLSRCSEGVEPATAWRNCELDWTSG